MTMIYDSKQRPLAKVVPDVLERPNLEVLATRIPFHLMQNHFEQGYENWDGSYRTPFSVVTFNNGIWTITGDVHISTGGYQPALESAFSTLRQSVGLTGEFSGSYQFISYLLSTLHGSEREWHTDNDGKGHSLILPLSEREGNWSGGDLGVRVGEEEEVQVIRHALNQGVIVDNSMVQHKVTRMLALKDGAVRNVLHLWYS